MHPSWPCIMAVHQYVPCALSLWLVCLAHCILYHTFSIGLVFMATESPKMLVYYIPVSLNYSPCKYSSFFYFRYCFRVAQSSDFYCPNRAVSTTYYRLKIQRKFCLNLWVLFKCVFDLGRVEKEVTKIGNLGLRTIFPSFLTLLAAACEREDLYLASRIWLVRSKTWPARCEHHNRINFYTNKVRIKIYNTTFWWVFLSMYIIHGYAVT